MSENPIGCTDTGCHLRRAAGTSGGMGTNGGCRCTRGRREYNTRERILIEKALFRYREPTARELLEVMREDRLSIYWDGLLMVEDSSGGAGYETIDDFLGEPERALTRNRT